MSKKNNKIPFKERKKSKKVAGLLGIFLGAFGIHNFYLGKYVRGILQFILALIFIFTLKDNTEFLIDSLLMLGSLGVGKGIAILCNEVDINKKYRLKHASKEENIAYATSALKKFPVTDSSLYIDYVSKNTTLSATDIKEIINKEKATINKRNQEIDDLKKQLEQEKIDKENEILNNPQDEIQEGKSNLEQSPIIKEEVASQETTYKKVTSGFGSYVFDFVVGGLIGVLFVWIVCSWWFVWGVPTWLYITAAIIGGLAVVSRSYLEDSAKIEEEERIAREKEQLELLKKLSEKK